MEKKRLDLFKRNLYVSCPWQRNKPNSTPLHYFLRICAANDKFIRLQDSELENGTDEVDEFFLQTAALTIYTSNFIEGAGLTLDHTNMSVRSVLLSTELPPSLNDHCGYAEVVKHAEAFKYLCVDNKGSVLSTELILETHRILMEGLITSAGAFRSGQVIIGRDHQSCIDPRSIQPLISEMIEAYITQATDQEAGMDPFVCAAWLKNTFVRIHPFEDGNGRLSRLLMNWSLLSSGLPFPISIIPAARRCNYKAKKDYLRCIATGPEVGTVSASLERLPKCLAALILEATDDTWSRFQT